MDQTTQETPEEPVSTEPVTQEPAPPPAAPTAGAYTMDQYAALKAAIAQGAMSVRYGDKEIRYRTLADMNQILAQMQAELFPTQRRSRIVYPTFSKF